MLTLRLDLFTFLFMCTVPDVFRGNLQFLASTTSEATWYWDKVLHAHKEDLCSLCSTRNTNLDLHFYRLTDLKRQINMWKKKTEKPDVTLGCLWFRTMANSRPSGEKAGTKAPLDFTGWQGGVRRDMGYVLVAHCMLYPTELQRQMRTFNYCNPQWESYLLHRPAHSPNSHTALFPLNLQAGDDELLPRCENEGR